MSWQEIEFEKLYAEDSRNGIYKAKDFHGSGIRMVNMGELFAFDRIGNQPMNLIQLTEREMGKNLLLDGDLLFGRRSLVEEGAGKCSLVHKPAQPMTFESSIIRVRVDKAVADPQFYFYYFKSSVGRSRVMAIVNGVTVKGIRGSELKRILVHCPPIEVQMKIRDVLSVYDDLITANQRLILLLEESGRLLYREWFVKLRFPGYEAVPVQDGVPQGWERSHIVDLCSLLNRGITPNYNDAAKGLVINQKCIRNGRLSMDQARRQSKEVKPDRLVQFGDVLINSTGAGTLGRVALVMVHIPECTVDTHITIARANDNIQQSFFGLALLELEPLFSAMGKGATNQTELSRADIGNVQILVPNEDVQKDFHEQTWPLLVQAQQLSDTNELLKEARDLLLPKLMSGALDVSRINLSQEVAA